MPTNTQVRELLLQWENLKKEGRPVSVDELCRDCPELIQTLQQQIEALETVDKMLLTAPLQARGTLQPHGANDFVPVAPPIANPASETTSGMTTIGAPRLSATIDLRSGAEPVPGYVLVERLGRGGFGEVWRATAPGGFPIALKFVPLAGQGLKIEMRALEIIKTIRHPNLLATFGAWQIQGLLVIAMELADRTLTDRFDEAIAQGLPGIPRDELLEYLQAAAKGIDYLNVPQPASEGKQGLGVQHRDIKPHNILLVGSGVKLADFGLARLLEHAMTAHTGSLTPAYAAPEFMRGQTSNRSDQYSLAVTYCELRGGRLPFEGNLEKMLLGHLERAPDLSMLPEAEQPIVARALAKNPADRWPTCRSFVEALVNQDGGARNSIAGHKQLPRGAGRRSRALSSMVLAGIFGLFILAVLISRDTTPPDVPVEKRTPVNNVKPQRQIPESNLESQIVQSRTSQSTVEESREDESKAAESAPTPQITTESANFSAVTKTDLPQIVPPAGNTAETTESIRETSDASTVPPVAAAPAASVTPDIRTPNVRVGELLRFTEHHTGVRSVAMSPNNRHVLSAGDDRIVRLWDIETGVEIDRFAAHLATVECVAFSPDGNRAISGADDNTLWLWDVAGKSKLRPLLGHTEAIYCVAFSADGSLVLSGGKDTTVRLWNVETGQELNQIVIPDESIWSVAFGPDNHYALVASDSNVVRLYNLETRQAVNRLDAHADVVWSVAYSEKTGRALSGGGDASVHGDFSVRLWDVERGKELHRFDGHRDNVGSVAFSPDGRRALSGSVDSTVRLWDLETRQALHCFAEHTDVVQCVAFSPDGRRALSASRDGTVRVWGLPR
jgi:WD40 repeat protein/serine/threonine protein kinase